MELALGLYRTSKSQNSLHPSHGGGKLKKLANLKSYLHMPFFLYFVPTFFKNWFGAPDKTLT